jgi:hypothetical protein
VLAVTIAQSGRSWFRKTNDHGLYVIELPGPETFASEAGSLTDADEVARAAWFAQAFDRFCSKRIVQETANNCLRVATDHEARAYQELADEFADEASGILVAYVGRAKSGR